MPRNGVGTYALPAGNPVVAGTTITEGWANTTLSDVATALTNSIAADGQTVVQDNIPMNGNKITGLGDATLAQDAVTKAQLDLKAPIDDPTFTGNLTAECIVFTLKDDGDSGTAKTVDFTQGNYHKLRMTGNCTITLTAPAGPCVVHIELTQDGTGSRTYSTSPALKWPGATFAADKLLSTAASARDLLILRYNGTDYVANLLKAIA